AGAERLCPQWQESWHTPWRAGNEYENDDESDRKPTFGFMPNDGIVVPHPPVARALEIVKQTLTNADFEGPIARIRGAYLPRNRERVPVSKRRPPIPLPEYEQYNDYWQSSAGKTSSGRRVDVVIAPAGPHSAIPPGRFIHSAYTSALNVLNFCIALRIRTWTPWTQTSNPLPTRIGETYLHTDDPELFDGTPAAIQLFGRRLGEERVLSVAQIVVDAVEAWKRKHHRE
ncbi:hypothetical protein QC763_305665, partial [Podospora pseudopauciseta]